MPESSPVWIKICGVRDVETAVRIARLGADAVGINFYAESPRCVADSATARSIVKALPESTMAVGVFVNHSSEQIRRICAETGLATVQLHGDEPVAMIGKLREFRVIRALRIAGKLEDVADREMEDCAQLHHYPAAWLLDARVDNAYGGTGQQIDWQRLASGQRSDYWPPLILAGGLTPENIAEAVRIVQPWGVDVASGVESKPGVKDLSRVQQFIDACRDPQNRVSV